MITKIIKAQLIDQEIAAYENTRYLLEIRHRVNTKLGAKDQLKVTEDELVKIEMALEELNKIKKEIETETEVRNNHKEIVK